MWTRIESPCFALFSGVVGEPIGKPDRFRLLSGQEESEKWAKRRARRLKQAWKSRFSSDWVTLSYQRGGEDVDFLLLLATNTKSKHFLCCFMRGSWCRVTRRRIQWCLLTSTCKTSKCAMGYRTIDWAGYQSRSWRRSKSVGDGDDDDEAFGNWHTLASVCVFMCLESRSLLEW